LRDHVAFGASLRRERERRGLSLAAIAEQTKVSAALLEGLERGDLSRWPAGIFRRGFVKAYADAVGLDPAEVLAEFSQLHPDDGTVPLAAPVEIVPRPDVAERLARVDHPLRLTLAAPSASLLSVRRLAGISLDLVVPAAGAVAIALNVLPDSAWAAVLASTVAYHAVGVLFHGTTIGTHIALRSFGQADRPRPVEAPAVRDEAAAADTEEEPARRGFTSPLRAARRERRQAARSPRGDGRSARH
jgi:transcriptional regulator with XRE-family HTH domain